MAMTHMVLEIYLSCKAADNGVAECQWTSTVAVCRLYEV